MSEIDWPAGFDRTPAADRERNRSFEATIADTTSDLATELDRMNVDEWRASTASGGAYTKSNGLPKHNANPDDPGFVLYWKIDGQQHAIACDDSPRLRDNMRYCYKWINETRMRSNRPVETGESEFATARLPSGNEDTVAADPPAHVVLGVNRDASPAEVEAAYRETAREVHPDAGGSDEAFKRAKRAKDELLPGDNECVTDGGTLTDNPIIGYVVGPSDDAVTVCTECAEPDDDTQAIHDSGVYGDQVPYPECWVCQELMRPETADTDDLVTDGGERVSDPGARVYCSNCKSWNSHDNGDCSICGETIAEFEAEETRVGHCKHDATDVYVGRGRGGRDMLSVAEPGQRGWLGNPFTLDDHSRAESIRAFRQAFEDKLQRDDEFRAAVTDLAGKTLGCWCQHVSDTEPGCHAEVIAEWADKLAREGDAALDDAERIVTDGGRPPLRRCSECGLIHRETEACRAANGGGDR